MINKIAAGEVIERPASVVKELVENSIDAESKRIEVIVEQAGMNLMRIVDDGIGMTEDQLTPAIMPHATSKISDTDDLFKINTFGFRGEALASIAEISQLTLRSRAINQNSGAEIVCIGGERSETKPCGMPTGTQIDVKNLFFNTPARRKYMKTASTEFGHIIDTVLRLAIPHPNIHFVLKHNDRTVYDLPADPSILNRIKLIFGEDVGNNLVYIESQTKGDVKVEGYVSLPSGSRLNNKLQYLFLNGRYIRDRSLQHALAESYRGLLTSNRFPVAFLNITMPPELFDVNVHPTKLEVRFLDSNRVYSALLGIVREKFLQTDLNEKVDVDAMKSRAIKYETTKSVDVGGVSGIGNIGRIGDVNIDAKGFEYEDPRTALDQDVASAYRRSVIGNIDFPSSVSSDETNFRNVNSGRDIFGKSDSGQKFNSGANRVENFVSRGDSSLSREQSSDVVDEVGRAGGGEVGEKRGDYVVSPVSISDRVTFSSSGRIAVQMHSRYLVLETEEGIAIIDQHALHERILYERLKSMMGDMVGGGRLESQRLLVPIPIDLNPIECAVVMDNLSLFRDLGLQVESFGGDTVIVSSLPTLLSGLPAGDILLSLIDPLMNRGEKPDPVKILDEMLHSMACKAAIKAGEKMSADSISQLLFQAELEINSHHCPHGRPSSLIFTFDEINKRFRR
jgi:DNA mismatch repair protein MutL